VHEPGRDDVDPALAGPDQGPFFYTVLDWSSLVSRAATRS